MPGVVVSQHSGEGKANQYYLRGFDLDHGTDIALHVAGVPVNMPTQAHGQGYADANFIMNVNYLTTLDHPLAISDLGSFRFERAMFAASPKIGDGILLYAVEAARNNGPWLRPDDYRKLNGVLPYSRGNFALTAMGYGARWNSTDQIPERAIDSGRVSRFGLIDPTDGGTTHRYSLAIDWERERAASTTRVNVYAIDYRLDLFSDFTYFLDDPVNGDQFEQADARRVFGMRASHEWKSRLGENVIGIQARADDIGNVAL